ncbi:MAG: hypothetical protein JWP91_4219 [Fibrobacteres bacterium]|nr:hypothetical protein [Fibrobacterota bacterium]
MKLYTIGFTKKSAEYFFTRLQRAGVRKIVDIRLNNVSQLSGFSKREDLQYFAKAICKADYVHLPDLAPSEDLFHARKKENMNWKSYERRFLDLIKRRAIEEKVTPDSLDGGCLLCTEDDPQHCHRRLVAEYLQEKWGGVEIIHLT